jgi:uncharacterized protein (TIGR04168 family)
MKEETFTIAVVGDVHEQWQQQDEDALIALAVDLVLFVGDFGNESVEIVRKISKLSLNKAVVLGNHDAWYTASDWGRKNRPYDPNSDHWFYKQLELLGESHIGYSSLEFSSMDLAVVGSRPFSWGGTEWKNADFFRDLYQVHNFQQSTEKIVSAARKTSCENVIFLAHNGPYGLGDHPYSICGKDWGHGGGDHGDPDLSESIKIICQEKKVPLVVFGHMHHSLRYTNEYTRQKVITDAQGIIYLNAASVPRIIERKGSFLRNFTLVSYFQGRVREISLVWLNENFEIISSEILLAKTPIMG